MTRIRVIVRKASGRQVRQVSGVPTQTYASKSLTQTTVMLQSFIITWNTLVSWGYQKSAYNYTF